ncbi:9028_t:CDS:2 [Diversispora eburnea]|uniref:9028_t:CDS:1 n=1 Tax=Diversispora eburnea TaxID=1213867 RepID=A0A9N8YNW2_9GLOM|nr:9028_t:CDS:2 [Diversispora eburnea]
MKSGSTSEIRERAAHVFLRKLRNNRYSGNKDSSSKKSKSYTGGEGPLSHDIIHESNTKIANDENK